MILRNKYHLIKELQNEAIKRRGGLKSGWNVIEAINRKTFSDNDVRKRVLSLVMVSDKSSGELGPMKIVYFQKRLFENSDFLWEMTFVKPTEQAIKEGEAKYIIDEKFDNVVLNYNKDISVLVILEERTFIIFFRGKYADIPKLINKVSIRKKQTYMKKGTKNIIAALIIGIAIVAAAIIYAYSTRWKINNNGSARIDKWTGKIERVHR